MTNQRKGRGRARPDSGTTPPQPAPPGQARQPRPQGGAGGRGLARLEGVAPTPRFPPPGLGPSTSGVQLPTAAAVPPPSQSPPGHSQDHRTCPIPPSVRPPPGFQAQPPPWPSQQQPQAQPPPWPSQQQPQAQAPPRPSQQQPPAQPPPWPSQQQPQAQAPPRSSQQQPPAQAPPWPSQQQPQAQAPHKPFQQQPLVQPPSRPFRQLSLVQTPPAISQAAAPPPRQWGPRTQAPTYPGQQKGVPSSGQEDPQAQAPIKGQQAGPRPQPTPSSERASPVMPSDKIPLLRRPDKGGTLGYKINLVVNFFRLKRICECVYQYDVDIKLILEGREPKDINKKFKRMLFEAFKANCPEVQSCSPVYDGSKIMLTPRPIHMDRDGMQISFEYEEDGRITSYLATVKPVKGGNNKVFLNELDRHYNHSDAMMAIEIIFRYRPALEFVPVGRSLFPKPKDVIQLSGGIEMWNGYYLSMQIGQAGPFINIDRASTAFYPAVPLMNLLFQMKDTKDINLIKKSLGTINKLISRIKIMVTVTNGYKRCYTLDKILPETPREKTFADAEGRVKTVENHFRDKYQYRLQYPDYPCVQMTSSRGNAPCLPLELCMIKSCQPYRHKLNEEQTTNMIKYNVVDPIKRFGEILNKMKDFNRVLQPIKGDYEIEVELSPFKLIGRILNPPKIHYSNRDISIKEGKWDLRGMKFLKPCSIKCWILISFAYQRFLDRDKLEKFAQSLTMEARTLGIEMASRQDIVMNFNTERATYPAYRNLFEGIKKKNTNLDLVVIVLSKRGHKEEHSLIKRACDIELYIPTQCIKAENVAPIKVPLIVNLLQKINTKMGGINSVPQPKVPFSIFNQNCIVMGADVNHPAPGDTITPSIAAVVGSIDPNPSRYFPSVRLQTRNHRMVGRLEIIQDLCSMTVELLKAYYKNNKAKPQAILFFRDGVSEGQFQEVLRDELSQIKNACRKLGMDYKPALTFVVVQKRHHARFKPEYPKEGVGKHQNIPPGTTVDTDITHPHNFDYYQCSHLGIQGTSRPTKYVVLHDENHFTSNDMQEMTNFLCHSFSRCTRSISLVAPAQYAHLVAFRAKEHLAAFGSNTSWTEGDLEGDTYITQEMRDAVAIKDPISKSMYFV